MTRHGLLASCVNAGGVFRIDSSGVECVSVRDTTGMCAWPEGMVWARQEPGASNLALLDAKGLHSVRLSEEHLDLHDVLWHGESLYLVATQTNTILRLDSRLRETGRWVLEGEHDSHHVNSICMHEGRLLATRFGDFHSHREYKGATRGAGQVIDVDTGQVLVSGLSQPHSLRSHQGMLWLCDSETHRVLAFRDGCQVEEIRLDGYTRGLLLTSDAVFVGLSRSRNVDHSGVETACVVELTGRGHQERSRTQLPAAEVYEVVEAIASMVDLRANALEEARAALHEAVHGRNAASAEGHELRSRLGVLEARIASTAEQAATTEQALGRLSHRVREDEAWAGSLQAEAHALRGHAESLERALLRSAEAIRQRDDYIASVRSSRSWRWSRPLRRAEPALPPPLLHAHETPPGAAVPDDGGSGQRAASDIPVSRQSDVQAEGIVFREHPEPVATILVTSYGHYDPTRACLEAIAACCDATPFEVLLVEDASAEGSMDRFATVPGLRYVRNPKNLGFVRSVNEAAHLARGRYLCLLNNDTRVHSGWLDALIESFSLLDGCGLAGSRLLHPDSRLQEAGGVVWNDASGCNVGRDGDAHAQDVQAARRVDYVSGASMMIPTHLFHELGGFDERFAPAYYEDTDLAFRVRQRGLHVYYQPRSIVEHAEGTTHGKDEQAGGKTAQRVNRAVFLEKWRKVLEREHFAPGEHMFIAREHSQLAKSVLVVDHHAPRPDRDAGSRAIWALLRALQRMGLAVRFWSLASDDELHYLTTLRRHGIDVRTGNARVLARWLGEHGAYIDNVVVSRPVVAAACIDAIHANTRARVVYYGHDIHYLRIGGHARLQGSDALANQARIVREMEERIWREADWVLYPTDEETSVVDAFREAQHGAAAHAATIPLFAYDDEPAAVDADPAAVAARNEILFVGNYEHAPNEDAALWFAREVWPSVHASHPELQLVLAGPNVTSPMSGLADASVQITGQIAEDELERRYGRARVVVAPLRFGAGLKGKVVEAMRHGVPVVTTPVGAQGLGDATSLVVVDGAAQFSDAVCVAATPGDAWRDASRAGQAYVRGRFSNAAIVGVLERVVDAVPYLDVNERRARVASVAAARETKAAT